MKKAGIFKLSVFLLFAFCFFLLSSCSIQKKIGKTAKADVLDNNALQSAHVGISIFDPAENKYLYNFQGDKYFVPASNTKIPTCYAAMKYLGDSLVGLRYGIPEEKGWKDKVIAIDATGDPTFFHSDFVKQPVFEFLTKSLSVEERRPGLLFRKNNFDALGNGWSWNDFESYYMAERSPFPIFGNVLKIKLLPLDKRQGEEFWPEQFKYNLFTSGNKWFDLLLNKQMPPITKSLAQKQNPKIILHRKLAYNIFFIEPSETEFKNQTITFSTNEWQTAMSILMDTLHSKLSFVTWVKDNRYSWDSENGDIANISINKWEVIKSQPTDSMLKPMMHRSDNFFAEQAMLMVSNEQLGYMDDGKIIDTLLKTDLKDLPQKPRWADGSGLSRYNLFTPQDFVAILNKMKNEFGMERLKVILPTGGEGTISSYYKADSGYIFGKTGTLSGVVAFSGFMYTKKGKLLIFSTLVNNHQASATDVRRAIEKFLQGIRNSY